MKKNYLGIALFLLSLFSCENKDLLNGIFVTGDHTTVLKIWKGEIGNTVNVSNFSDSSRISYPAYWLAISDKFAVLHTRADANADRVSYYILSPNLKQNTNDRLEIDNLKLIYARAVVAGIELIGADETKSVILNGTIEKK